MVNAALIVRKWSADRARRVRTKFARSSRGKIVQSGSDSSKKIPSNEKYCDYETTVSIQLHLYERNEPSHVMYKKDEDRFSQEITLKLKTFTLYNVLLEVDNNDDLLMYVILGGKKYNCFKMIEKPEGNGRIFGFVWSTDNIKVTERKHRSTLPCVLGFKDHRELLLSLSIKFYEKEEFSRYTGTPLSTIHLDGCLGNESLLKSISFE